MKKISEFIHETYDYETLEEAIAHERSMLMQGWEIVGRWTEFTTEFRKQK